MGSCGEKMRIGIQTDNLRQTKWHEYAVRFVLGGAITVLAGLIANRFGPAIGGLFLAFPAIFPASATMIEKHERRKKAKCGLQGVQRGRKMAGVEGLGAAIGSLGLIVFALVSWRLLEHGSSAIALFLATLGWLGTSLGGWLLQKRLW
jgi:hypothetical protein